MLRRSGLQAVAIEALPDRTKVASAWQEVFDDAALADTYINLTPSVRTCIENVAERNWVFAGARLALVSRTHIGAFLFLIEQLPSFQSRSQIAVGTEYLAASLAKSMGLSVEEIEGAASLMRAYVSLPRDEIVENIRVYCNVLQDKQLVEKISAFGTAQLSKFLIGQRIDTIRSEQEAFYGRVGLTNYSLRMVDSRNELIATNILLFAQRHSCSMAMVGALHLSGPNALPRLLRERGAHIRAVETMLTDIRC